MTAAKLNSNGVDARLIKAKHHEIAIRYRQGKKRFSMAAIRCAELDRLFVDRYGRDLPDDDAGKDDALVMAHHLAMMSGDQRTRMKSWLVIRAPWMSADEMEKLIDTVITKPIRWRADKLAARLNLREAERARLGIKTIGAVDMTKAEREAARQARKRKAKREGRRARGMKSRAEYEAAALGHGRPWEAEGVSKATWYRRQRIAKQ
jgi:hypothetical protein